MLERLLLLWLVVLSALAYFWPELGLGFDPFLTPKLALDILFGLVMFLIGSLLPIDEVRQLRHRWPSVLGGTAVQYLTMPLFAYLIGRWMNFSDELLFGIVVVGCVPGAMASNVLTLAAHGNVSYSVSLTTMATLLSPLVVPFALWLTLGQKKNLDPLATSIKLILQVVGPVILGHLLARRYEVWQGLAKKFGPPLANLTILWIIAVVVGLNRSRLATVVGSVVGALLILNLLGYSSGYFAGKMMRLPEGMRRALTLEIGMQNAGLGTLLARDLFPETPASQIPPAAYTFGCMLTGSVLATLWAWRGVESEPKEKT